MEDLWEAATKAKPGTLLRAGDKTIFEIKCVCVVCERE